MRELVLLVAVTMGIGLLGCDADTAAKTTGGVDSTSSESATGAGGAETGASDSATGAGGAETGAGGAALVPESCFSGAATCDPRTNEGCGDEEACDVGEENGALQLLCFPPPNDAAAGEPCDLHDGPFCKGGLVCGPAATCIAFCCADEECSGPDEICNPIAAELGAIGGCIDPAAIPECAPFGAPCSTNEDCCSNDCHGDHCH